MHGILSDAIEGKEKKNDGTGEVQAVCRIKRTILHKTLHVKVTS